jgi:hypothetical protein
MKLFTSSQDTSSNVMQNAGVELSEQELSAVSGGCGGGCGHQDPGLSFIPGGQGEQGFGNFGAGESFTVGESIGIFYPLPRPCHPHHHHCCRY